MKKLIVPLLEKIRHANGLIEVCEDRDDARILWVSYLKSETSTPFLKIPQVRRQTSLEAHLPFSFHHVASSTKAPAIIQLSASIARLEAGALVLCVETLNRTLESNWLLSLGLEHSPGYGAITLNNKSYIIFEDLESEGQYSVILSDTLESIVPFEAFWTVFQTLASELHNFGYEEPFSKDRFRFYWSVQLPVLWLNILNKADELSFDTFYLKAEEAHLLGHLLLGVPLNQLSDNLDLLESMGH